MEIKKINEFFDERASTIVGILLKRIEVLEREEKKLKEELKDEEKRKDVKVLTPSLYKSLVKENIYEQFRQLKELFEVKFKIGRVEFKSREKK